MTISSGIPVAMVAGREPARVAMVEASCGGGGRSLSGTRDTAEIIRAGLHSSYKFSDERGIYCMWHRFAIVNGFFLRKYTAAMSELY
jgi:hypothetical protein